MWNNISVLKSVWTCNSCILLRCINTHVARWLHVHQLMTYHCTRSVNNIQPATLRKYLHYVSCVLLACAFAMHAYECYRWATSSFHTHPEFLQCILVTLFCYVALNKAIPYGLGRYRIAQITRLPRWTSNLDVFQFSRVHAKRQPLLNFDLFKQPCEALRSATKEINARVYSRGFPFMPHGALLKGTLN